MKPTAPLLAACIALAGLAQPIGRCCAQSQRSVVTEMATIDANTRWALRTIPEASVASPIVRLGDVVQPLDPKLPLWKRLGAAPIAMFPVNTHTMTIDRDRLDRAIRKTEATPQSIDWYGPREIKVTRDRSVNHASTARQPTARQPSVRPSVVPAAYQQVTPGDAAVRADGHAMTNPHRSPSGSSVASAHRPPVGPAVAQRISHWIKVGIGREQPVIADSFELTIDPQQPALADLVSIAGVTMAEPVDPVASGVVRFRITGRSVDGPVESVVSIQLTEFPQLVVPRTTLGRGHRISEHDLTYAPVHPDELEPNMVTDMKQLVGMEVRTTLRADQPIEMGEVGSPILIHRGDLVEVRVLSGGVTVTTNAKALSDGSESDLIEIETMRPRKRLLARVVQTGLVEIVTRAPSLRYRERTTE